MKAKIKIMPGMRFGKLSRRKFYLRRYFFQKIKLKNMDNKIDIPLYTETLEMALKVDFLTNSEEVTLYASSLYLASIWGQKTT